MTNETYFTEEFTLYESESNSTVNSRRKTLIIIPGTQQIREP